MKTKTPKKAQAKSPKKKVSVEKKDVKEKSKAVIESEDEIKSDDESKEKSESEKSSVESEDEGKFIKPYTICIIIYKIYKADRGSEKKVNNTKRILKKNYKISDFFVPKENLENGLKIYYPTIFLQRKFVSQLLKSNIFLLRLFLMYIVSNSLF